MLNYLNSKNPKLKTNIPVLYIDDNSNDLFFVERVVQKTKSNLNLFCLNSVTQGIAYLNRSDQFSDLEKFPIPSFVLLDYSIGAHTGPDLLRWMRARPVCPASLPASLRTIPGCNRRSDPDPA